MMRRICRNSHGPGVEARKERNQITKPGRVKNKDTFVKGTARLQPGRNCARSSIKLLIRIHAAPAIFCHKGVCVTIGLSRSTPLQYTDNARRRAGQKCLIHMYFDLKFWWD